MHSFKKSIVVAISSMFLLSNVKAVTCGYEEKAKLNNEIANVKANYEIKERIMDPSEYTIPDSLTDEESKNFVATEDYIQVNVLNLTENLYVEVSNDYDNEVKTYNYSSDTKGNISFSNFNLGNVITYTISVKTSSNTSCPDTVLKTLSVKTPRYNEYSSYGFCEKVPEYYLCQKYVTYEEVDFGSFVTGIRKEVDKMADKDKEKAKEKWYNKVGEFISKHKVVFITGGVVLISAAGVATFIIIKKRRRSII